MAKSKLKVHILDIGKVEAIKDLINELLDTIETLRTTECNGKESWDVNEALQERKGYFNRFAEILTGDEK
jgi:hypothetical protein